MSERVTKTFRLPLAEIPETNLMSDRNSNDNLPTLETPRNADNENTSTTLRPPGEGSRSHLAPFRQLSHIPNDISSSQQIMNRTRSSNLSLVFPNTKSRLLRKLSMVKGVGRVSKPSAFVSWFGTPKFLTVSTMFAVVLAVATTFSLKPLACTGWQGFYPFLSILWVCNLYFGFETTMLAWIEIKYYWKQGNQVVEINDKVLVKSMARFSWFGLVSVLGNIIYASVYPSMCTSNSFLVYLSQLVVCLNYAKLVRRIGDFKKIFKVMLQVMKWFAGNAVFFLLLVLALALITYSLFNDSITYCTSSRVAYIKNQDCEKYQGSRASFPVNYSTVWTAAIAIYLSLNRVTWFHLLELSLINEQSWDVLYEVAHFMVVITLCTYLYLAFEGMAISLNYITIERLSIHNAGDPLSRAGQQMIMTEELVIQKGLPLKPHINKNRISELCQALIESRCWSVSYSLFFIGSFIFSWTQKLNESDELRQARFVVNITVLALVNFNTYIIHQAVNFMDIFTTWSGWVKLVPILVIDLAVLICSLVGIESSLPFYLVYWYIFTVVESLLKYIDSSSPFFDTLRSLLAQAFYYFKCFLFIICLIMTFVHFFMYVVTIDNELHGYSLGFYLGTVMTIIGDSQWSAQINQFAQAFSGFSSAGATLATLVVYISQFLLKHLVFSFFFGVVVSKSIMANRIKAFIFNEETLDELVKAWMEHDTEGTGLMDASLYLDFVLNLKQPIALSSQDLRKKLRSLTLDLRAIYSNMYATNSPESMESGGKWEGVDLGNFITRQIYKANKDKSIRLTVDQFFVYCRLYNVPIYIYQNRCCVHWRDVSRTILRIALESTLDDKMDTVFDDKKIQPKLEKEWVSRFPGLTSLKESIPLQRVTKGGKRLPYLQHLDILYYQAALVFQRFFRRDQSKKEVKLAALRSKKLKPLQELEDDQAQKIQSIFESAKTFVDKLSYDKLITNYQSNLKLKQSPKESRRLGDNRSISGCPSPYFRSPSIDPVQNNGRKLFQFTEFEPAQSLAYNKTEVLQSIEDFGAIGLQQAINFGSDSSSASREDSP